MGRVSVVGQGADAGGVVPGPSGGERSWWFGSTGDSRWDPPGAADGLFGTCYAGTDRMTAVMEAFGDLPVVTEAMVDARSIAVIGVAETRRLADMTSPVIVGRWRLDRRLSVGDDYAICQRWAHSLRLAGFGGIYYEPRHVPRAQAMTSVALFADPGYQPQEMTVVDEEAISAPLIAEINHTFGLRVLPGAPLPPT
ncbi:MAG: RES family NAD+ phosphorylase [Actinomycetota bacterium]|nr:RES family NAD+ phosphorylase [Actinomycetota bacterium]